MKDYTNELIDLSAESRVHAPFMAKVYALAIADGYRQTDWAAVNAAITKNRGPLYLSTVKRLARRERRAASKAWKRGRRRPRSVLLRIRDTWSAESFDAGIQKVRGIFGRCKWQPPK